MIDRIVSFALSQRFMVLVAMLALGDLGRRLVSESADRRLSRSGAAPRPDRFAVAGPRRRGSRAPDHHPARDRDERHPEAGCAALDFALRALVGDDELRLRHRSVLRPGAGLPAHARRGSTRRGHAGDVPALQSERPDLSLRAAEPGPLGPGSEDPPGVGARAEVPLDPGRGGRLRARRSDHAVPGPARSEQAGVVRRQRVADHRPARRQQRQRRRRLLLAGRAVLLRARARPGQGARRHRQHRDRDPHRHPGLRERRRHALDGTRPTARAVRVHARQRRGRGRDPDARRRAGAGRAARRSSR